MIHSSYWPNLGNSYMNFCKETHRLAIRKTLGFEWCNEWATQESGAMGGSF